MKTSKIFYFVFLILVVLGLGFSAAVFAERHNSAVLLGSPEWIECEEEMKAKHKDEFDACSDLSEQSPPVDGYIDCIASIDYYSNLHDCYDERGGIRLYQDALPAGEAGPQDNRDPIDLEDVHLPESYYSPLTISIGGGEIDWGVLTEEVNLGNEGYLQFNTLLDPIVPSLLGTAPLEPRNVDDFEVIIEGISNPDSDVTTYNNSSIKPAIVEFDSFTVLLDSLTSFETSPIENSQYEGDLKNFFSTLENLPETLDIGGYSEHVDDIFVEDGRANIPEAIFSNVFSLDPTQIRTFNYSIDDGWVFYDIPEVIRIPDSSLGAGAVWITTKDPSEWGGTLFGSPPKEESYLEAFINFLFQGEHQVNTPNTIIISKDTDFAVAYNADTGETIVELYDGAITVTSKESGAKEKISNSYGEVILRIDIGANGEMRRKIAVPQKVLVAGTDSIADYLGLESEKSNNLILIFLGLFGVLFVAAFVYKFLKRKRVALSTD